MPPVRPPVRDRVLLYLLKFTGFENEVEVPVGLTQKGMARSLGVKRAQVAQVLRELKDKGMVVEKIRHVKDSPRRLKSYFLTGEGRTYGEKLKRVILERLVEFTDEMGKIKQLSVKDLIDCYDKRVDLSVLLRAIDAKGCCTDAKIQELLERLKTIWVTTVEEEKVALKTELEVMTVGPEDTSQSRDGPKEGVVDFTHHEGPFGPRPPGYPEREGPSRQVGSAWSAPSMPVGKPRPWRILFVIGFALILSSVFLGFFMYYLFDPVSCLVILSMPFVGMACVVGYYISLRRANMEKLEKMDRRMIIGTALITAYVLGCIASRTFTGHWTDEETRLLLGINIPLVFVLLAHFLIPMEVRTRMGIIIGTFLFAMAIGAWVSRGAFAWITLHPVMWMATSVMSVMVANEIGRPRPAEIGLSISTGLGLYIIMASGTLIYDTIFTEASYRFIQGNVYLVGAVLVLWLVLGFVTLMVRWTTKVRQMILFEAMGISAVACIGFAFMIFGLWFLKHQGFEGAIDLMIGLPVLYYGLLRLKGKKGLEKTALLGLMAYSVLLEVLSLGLLLGIFS